MNTNSIVGRCRFEIKEEKIEGTVNLVLDVFKNNLNLNLNLNDIVVYIERPSRRNGIITNHDQLYGNFYLTRQFVFANKRLLKSNLLVLYS